ncbi:hypothetical protein GQ53DRAFT_374980 [Thozetella sp. PMI_491]|nr:hypothetical protein GQ53DRAFT_374980 [Thozetella sp. PMI_491]
MTGLAVKLCISFGLHRRACTSRFGIRSELDKRLFWTCYILDRDVTFTMGRPPSICDHDIDIQLPLDVNEDSIRPDEFRNAMARDPGLPADPPTTLTRFIHLVRLKRIGSRIQHTIYRVDRPIDSSENKEEAFLQQIEDWRERIPKKHQEEGPNNLLHNYMAQYHSCIRFLLFARLTEETVNPRFFEMGVQACIGVCKAFKRVHQQCITNLYTPMTTMSLFLAGFTLLYCHWRSPEAMAMSLVHDALTDCAIMLYVMTERWRPAEKYRKAFECLKQLIVDRNSQQDHATVLARNIPLEPETRTTLDGIHQDLGIDAFSQMIMEVTGGDYADRQGWDATAFQTTFEDDAHAFDDSEAYEFDPLMANLSFWDAAAGDPEGFFAR